MIFEILNGECDAMANTMLDMTLKDF